MATSGVVQTRTYYNFQVKLSWTLSSQDDVNNTSTISWALTGENSTGISETFSVTITSLVINGETKLTDQYYTFSTASSYQLASGTMTIAHNHDGTKLLPIDLSVQFLSPGSGSRYSVSNSFALPDISKISTISASDFYIGDALILTITRKGATYADSLKYKIVGESDYHGIASYSTDATITFAGITNNACNYMASNQNYVEVEIVNTTYDGIGGSYALVGEDSITIKAYGKDAVLRPVVTSTNISVRYNYDDTNTLTGATDIGILNYSKIGIQFSPRLQYNATLVSQKITLAGVAKTEPNQETGKFEFQPLAASYFTYEVVDSRGYRTTGTYNLTVVNYVVPTVAIEVVPPAAADGNTVVTVKGNLFTGSFGNTTNSVTVQYGYKLSTASSYSYTTLTKTVDGNTYTATGQLVLDYTKTYNFRARIKDSANTTYTYTPVMTIKTVPIIEWNSEQVAVNGTFKANEILENGTTLSSKYFNGLTTYVLLGNGSASSSTSKNITDSYDCGVYEIIFKADNKFWSLSIPKAWATGNYYIYCYTTSGAWGWKIAKSNTTLTISTDQATSANFYIYGIR